LSRVLVLGGARSGKSAYAEHLLGDEASVTYVATAVVDGEDVDWAARVAAHLARRPANWTTIETIDLVAVLNANGAPVLVDSVTAWLTATMDVVGIWEAAPGACAELGARIDAVVAAWAGTARHVVAVSDEVGLGVVPESASGRVFRDALGLLNQALAATADEVYLVTAGIPLRLK
jgi:adenosylcobinamide kinase/adenosylcobinamide-phosphate guanylyltransferase